MTTLQKNDSINKGLDFLTSVQSQDGSFVSYSSPQPYEFQTKYTYKTTFGNSIILRCIADITESRTITAPLASYLVKQAQKNGAYNYWDSTSPEYHQLPYPNDLDDTFCALSALALFNSNYIDGAHMAQATVLLTQTESKAGGPYFTWITSMTEAAWKDLDVVVNANILFFLRTQAILQPQLETFIDTVITGRNFYSPYYPSKFHVLYFVSLAVNHASKTALATYMHELLRLEQPRSALEYAMTTIILEQCNEPKQAAKYRQLLISMQQHDGSWPAAAYCIDPMRDHRKHYGGSAALTTAFALQALSYRYTEKSIKIKSTRTLPLIGKALQTANKQLEDTDDLLQKDLSRHIQLIAEGNYAHEIIASPYFFYKSLSQAANTLPKDFLESVSTANTFGWIAYTIYDDFIDDEGIPELLPAANVAHRKSLINFFQAVSYKSQYREYILRTFNTIDAANKWELQYCRQQVENGHITITHPPDYGERVKLAEKSIGHTLPFLLVSLYCGLQLYESRFQKLETALRHYLIARQLHDDAHDWQEDLSKGHVSFIVSEIIKEARIQPGKHNIGQLIAEVQDIYWRKTLPNACTIISEHLKSARRELNDMGYSSTSLGSLIERLENATTKTVLQQRDTLLFLDTYRALTQNRH